MLHFIIDSGEAIKLKISKTSLLIFTVLLLLTSRVLIDIIWPGTKPVLIVLSYTAFCFLVSLYLLIKGRASARTSALLLFLFPCTLLVSQFNSGVDPFVHIKFALQVFTPCFFLVASTGMPLIMQEIGLNYKRRLAAIFLLIQFIATYNNYTENSLPGQSIYDYFQNAPDHVIAQTVLKSSLPLITSSIFWTSIFFSLIILLNVRSVMLANLLSITYINKDEFLKRRALKYFIIFGIPLIAFVASQVDWADFYNRSVFKGRDVTNETNIADAASSGRIGIYQFYISYIIENFGISEWLFGIGPIWLQPDGPSLSAHNDILNLLVSFGLIGLSSTLFCYFYFFAKLPSIGRRIFLITFSVLFLTNGVVFHQSNILFVLLYIYFRTGDDLTKMHPAKLDTTA